MELIAEQIEQIDHVKELYYFSSNQTEKYAQRDHQAALKIQSKFKMYIKRKQFLTKKQAAIKIETLWRAFYAKKMYKALLTKQYNHKNLLYFSQQAIMIQKVFRGYFVRKYKHNFYLRKAELQALQTKNQQFKDQLSRFGKAQLEEAEEYQKQLSKAEFEALAKNLHHLSSTKNIPGVYNSPFALDKPAVFEKTVEEHLKQAFKQSYKWKPLNKQQILQHTIKSSK